MNVLRRIASSYFARNFIYFHSVTLGLFGLVYLLYLKDYHITKQAIYDIMPITFTFSLMVTLIYWMIHSQSKWTGKRYIRVYLLSIIGTCLGLGFFISWMFFEEYKEGYFLPSFFLTTGLAFGLRVTAFISNTVLQYKNEEEKL